MALNVTKIVQSYGKSVRKIVLNNKLKANNFLVIGFGGTISSAYSPAKETISPLATSAAAQELEQICKLGVNSIAFDHIALSGKDSRELKDKDIFELLDCIRSAPNKKILITAGTYMLPRIAEIILRCCQDEDKVIGLTGSILPAGFMASDASANVWSTVSVINNLVKDKVPDSLELRLVFHGRTYETLAEIRKADFHPAKTQAALIQYPLTATPVRYKR